MRPQPPHAGEVVLELGQLDLELALGGVRVAGEDVEDDRRAVDDGHAQLLLEVSLLARRQLVVAGHQVRVGSLQQLAQLLHLARPQIGVRVGAVTMLHELTDDGDSRRPEQLL